MHRVCVLLLVATALGFVPIEAANQSFAVALPELEGPVTLAIFSDSGELVHLLHRDAAAGSIPAGLNGLIMTWDGLDDRGRDVPAGAYNARGLVHGPLEVSALPFTEPAPLRRATGANLNGFSLRPTFLKSNGITVQAARDKLLESRPLLAIDAVLEGNSCVLRAEGLPLLSVPVGVEHPLTLSVTWGPAPGIALLRMEGAKGTSTYTISGLDLLVPLNAGSLMVPADAFHPAPVAGESTP